jgi:hypothetical protein
MLDSSGLPEKNVIWSGYLGDIVRNCEFLSSHLLNLLTVQVFIWLNPEQARDLVRKQGDILWVNAISYLPVKEKFYFNLLVSPRQSWWETTNTQPSDKELNLLMDPTNEVLREKLIPMSLREHIPEDDGGLGRLVGQLSLDD